MKVYINALFSRLAALHLFRRNSDGLFLLGLGAILVGIGFLIGIPSGNHDKMLQFADAWVWSAMFLFYGISKFVIVAYPKELPKLKIWLCLYGLWLWTYTALSFLIYDPTTPAPTEFMMLLPVLLEAWIFTSLLEHNKPSSRRKLNARP